MLREAITITINDFRVPGWNTIMRMHWTEQARRNDEAWMLARVAMGNRDWRELDYPVDVHVIATFKGNALDSDNICTKFLIDAIKTKKVKGEIVERRILQEDDPKWVRRVTGESRRGKVNGVEIILTEVASTP